MAKKIKFPLKMANDVQVRTLDELQEHFDFQAVYSYFDDGRLTEWLEARYYEEEAEKIKKLDKTTPDLRRKLHEIFGVVYQENVADSIDLEDISTRNERLEKLKTFTFDNKILKAVDSVAFTQEELASLLDDDVKIIYLCGDSFRIPGSKEGVFYIGVNNPKVELPDDFVALGIKYKNVRTNIGDIISQAKACTDDVERAKLWLVAAEMGDAEAQVELGKCYYNGEGIEQNYGMAFECFSNAAGKDNPEGQFELGRCYYNGYGTEQNYKMAYEWSFKAAKKGNSDGQFVLGVCYDYGKGVEKNTEEAIKWYCKSSEQGYAKAQYNLACLYGTEENYEMAVKWLNKSAEQGYSYAQYMLGDCYYNGKGVEEDKKIAVVWYRKAAEQGDDEAQNSLGNCYRFGEGVEKNLDEAEKWFSKASKNGNTDAESALNNLEWDKINDAFKIT